MRPKFTRKMLWAIPTVALALSGSLMGHARMASADNSATQCAQTEDWTFSPALTTAPQVGTYSFTFNQTCATVDATTLGSGVYSAGPATVSGSYNGSCLTAGLSNGAGILVGGTVAVFPSAVGGHYHVLAPANPCLDSGPTPAVSGTTWIP